MNSFLDASQNRFLDASQATRDSTMFTFFKQAFELVDLVVRARHPEEALVVAAVQVDDAHTAVHHGRYLGTSRLHTTKQ